MGGLERGLVGQGALWAGVDPGVAFRICCLGRHIGVQLGVLGVGVCLVGVGVLDGITLLVEIENHFQVALIAGFF